MATKAFFTILLSIFSVTTAFAQNVQLAETNTVGAGSDTRPLIPEPAAKSPCSGLIVLGFQGDYPLQDFGVDASGNKAVSQDMFLVSCGKFAVDVWTSAQISDGRYGQRGTGDEWDLELTYDDGIDTPIGKINYEAYVAYFALDLDKGLGSAKDDYVEAHGEVSRSVEWGILKITPYFRYIHLFPINLERSLDFARPGVRLDVPVVLPVIGELSWHIDAARAFTLAGPAPHESVWRGEVDVTKPLWDGWSVTLGVKLTEFVSSPTPLVKLSYSF